MIEVTVKQLADDVNVPVNLLLQQIVNAGLSQRSGGDMMSNDEKQKLLSFLKGNHGDSLVEPRQITLKRRTMSTLKSSGSQNRGKSINVEVRKKRTYVKRVEAVVIEEVPSDLVSLDDATSHKAENPSEIKDAQVSTAIGSDEDIASPVVSMPPSSDVPSTTKDELKVESEEPESTLSPVSSDIIEEKKTVASDKEETHTNTEIAAKPALNNALPKNKKSEPFAVSPDSEENRSRKKKSKSKSNNSFDKGEEGKNKKHKSAGHNKAGRNRTAEFNIDEERTHKLKYRKKSKLAHNQHAFEKPVSPKKMEIIVPETIPVSELALRMSVKGAEVIKQLFSMGVMVTINQVIDQETASLIVEEMGHIPKMVMDNALEQEVIESISYEGNEEGRAPVVSVMGHVDHGKTSLLDHIRSTKVTAGESGGITQHIGAYHVETGKGMITFLDTPGHAAFTAMRARGAQSTDIVILVVAADDGVMPQTEEAVQHAKSAGVPLVVAVNKIDKEGADSDRVKNELSAIDVIPEDWGGDVQFVNVSAHTGEGVDDLLDAVLLQAELLELRAVPEAPAKGVVVEASLDKGRGVVSTVLVQNGTLKQGDIVIAGMNYGRIRALLDENGNKISEAGPSIPVEILGMNGAPNAGDTFTVVANERKAKEVASFRLAKYRELKLQKQQKLNLENIFQGLGDDAVKSLNVVLKTDVRGSLEAITSALQELGNDEVQVKIVSSGVGGIAETDANLALASNAIIFGFNVRADSSARKIIEEEGLDLRYYSIIYEIIDEVKKALTGMLAPEFKENILGVAEVRDTFRSPRFGQVAGCMVIEGNIYRNKSIRVLRDSTVIFEGELESLRRFKDDVAEVRSGMECGVGVKNYDVKVGDKIEVFEKVQVERTLDS